VVNNTIFTLQSGFSTASIAKHSLQSLDFHLRESTVSIAGKEIISQAILTNLFNLQEIVRYQSLSKNHKSPVLYHFSQSISSKGDSKSLSIYSQNTFNHFT
jgi:hypothetical protein